MGKAKIIGVALFVTAVLGTAGGLSMARGAGNEEPDTGIGDQVSAIAQTHATTMRARAGAEVESADEGIGEQVSAIAQRHAKARRGRESRPDGE